MMYENLNSEKLTDMTLVSDFCNCFLCPFLRLNDGAKLWDSFKLCFKTKIREIYYKKG